MDDLFTRDGNTRVRLSPDAAGVEPFDESGCPILRVDNNGTAACVTDTKYGTPSEQWGFDAVAALKHFWLRLRPSDAVSAFSRYVSIFHEGTTYAWNVGIVREHGYVAFTTRAMADHWGIPSDKPVPPADLDEWKAYCTGDVWLLDVSHKATWVRVIEDEHGDLDVNFDDRRETWELGDEGYCGLFGQDYAMEAARELLATLEPKKEQDA